MNTMLARRYSVLLSLFFFAALNGAQGARTGPEHAAAGARSVAPTTHLQGVFLQNRGRIVDTEGRRRDDILYEADLGALHAYFFRDAVSYVFSEPVAGSAHSHAGEEHSCAIEPRRQRFRSYRVDVVFEGARAAAVIESDGATLTYHGIQEGVDLRFTLDAGRLKYEFIAGPGTNAGRIALRYIGAEGLALLQGGDLRINTPLGAITERAPFVYQDAVSYSPTHATGSDARDVVPSAYVLEGDRLSFRLGAYDTARPLILDPFVEWSTYYGGNWTDFGTSTAIDQAGNIYLVGWTESSNFPATPGAIQERSAGKAEAFIAKFAPDGARLWTTHYGGSDDDLAMGVAIAPNGDVAVAGYTLSSDFPVTRGAFQETKKPDADGFIAVFRPDGTIRWCTYFGGSNFEEIDAVAIDGAGAVFVTGRTISGDLPVSFPTYQFTKSGDHDLFIAKFRADGSRAWATYYGGVKEDWGHDISVDGAGNVIVCGHSESPDFPVTAGAFQSAFEGERDCILLKFSSTGSRIFSTLIGGWYFDDAYSVAAAGDGSIALCGTVASNNFPNSAGAFQLVKRGTWDAFIGRFMPDGTRHWLTLYGGGNDGTLSDEEAANGIAVYPSGNIIVTGRTRSLDFPVTGDAAQAARAGKLDAFVVKMRRDGSRIWASYFGGTDDESEVSSRGLAAIAADWRGTAVITGWTNSTDFPVTSGAAQRTKGTGWDAFLVKFGCTVAPPPAIAVSGPTSFCEGDSTVLDAGPGYSFYHWSTGDSTRSITVRASGVYTVDVVDSSDCGGTSSPVTITVFARPRPSITASGPTIFCVGDSVRLDAGGGYVRYTWSTGDITQTVTLKASAGVTVTVTDNNGCTGTSSQVDVVVNPRPTAAITASGPTSFCEGGSVDLDAGAGFVSYAWSSGETVQRITVTRSGSYSVRVRNVSGCDDSTSVLVRVFPLPAPVITALGPTTFCDGDSVVLDAGAGFRSYLWSGGDRTRSIVVKRGGTYAVTVTDSNTCTATSAGVTVVVNPLPTPAVAVTGDTVFCEGGSVQLDAGAGYVLYKWSSGESSRSITVTRSGAYSVLVGLATGCSAVSRVVTVTVFPNPRPVITANGPLVFCDGDSVTLAGPPGFVRYAWSGGESTRSIVVKRSGNYALTVTDTNGCIGSATAVDVVVNPLPAVPLITQDRDTLFSTPEVGYQWLLNGVPLPGETGRFLLIPRSGTYTVRVTNQFGCSALSAPRPVRIALATVTVPVLRAAPGERVSVPVTLTFSEDLLTAGAGSFTARLRFNNEILEPVAGSAVFSQQGTDRIVDISGPLRDTIGVLATFECTAMLGRVDRVPITLERFNWDAGAVRTTMVSGEFQIIACLEGGVRLFDGSVPATLAQNRPNPFNATTTIDYAVVEAGPVRLEVIDMLGRSVAILEDGHKQPGAYRVVFDAGSLPSGLYHAVLQTPTMTLLRAMSLVK